MTGSICSKVDIYQCHHSGSPFLPGLLLLRLVVGDKRVGGGARRLAERGLARGDGMADTLKRGKCFYSTLDILYIVQ